MKTLSTTLIFTVIHLFAFNIYAADFEDNANATITDHETGLMWQKGEEADKQNWLNALSYCDNLRLADYDDWRLPDIKELLSLVDDTRFSPAIDTVYFRDIDKSAIYWSSTTNLNRNILSWAIQFIDGVVLSYSKHDLLNVRCVR